MTPDQTEILNRGVADAVVGAVRDKPDADVAALSLLAVNVATAIAAGFAAVSASGAPLVPVS